MNHKEFSSKGGRARAKKYTKEQLSEWARMGFEAREKNKHDKLMEEFIETHPWLLDDDIPDAFDEWLAEKK
jgi:hypothetical protein